MELRMVVLMIMRMSSFLFLFVAVQEKSDIAANQEKSTRMGRVRRREEEVA